MRKTFLNAVLFSAAFATATGTLVSCKDYDDDIASLQEQINQKATATELTSQLSGLSSDLAATKSALNSEVEALKKQIAEAEKGAGEAAVTLAKTLEDKLAEMTKTVDAKMAAIADAEKKIEALKADIQKANDTQLAGLAEKVDAMTAQVTAIVGHRLTSLSLIPTQHINGIASLTMTSLVYTPQVYNAKQVKGTGVTHVGNAPLNDGLVLDHEAVVDAKTKKAVAPNVISNGSAEAYFHVSPSIGVRNQDVSGLNFMSITSQNTTRAAGAPAVDQVIKPVSFDIKDGVMTVKYNKATTGNIFTSSSDLDPKTGALVNNAGHVNDADGTEYFNMVALRAAVSKDNWTAAEKAAGDPVYVYSEYSRVAEDYKRPYLMNNTANVDGTKWTAKLFADEIDDQGKYVHYHDSLSLYTSGDGKLIDYQLTYDKEYDLMDYVAMCLTDINGNGHEKKSVKDAETYGLKFRFALAKAAYKQGKLETNEQEFATLNGSKITSKVYNVAEYPSKTSIGREPIIRIELIDTNNNNALVAQRYMKIQWVEKKVEIPAQTIPAKDLGVQDVWCYDMYQQLLTQAMNEDVYHQVTLADGSKSISKNDFHKFYDGVKVLWVKKDGALIYEDGKTTYKDADKATMTAVASADITNELGASTKIWDPMAKLQEKEGKEAILSGNQILFGFLVDPTDKIKTGEDSNLSYNIVWAMSPAAVGTVKDGGSKFEIAVQYFNTKGLYSAINQNFTQTIAVPTQEFNYQGTYWRDGKPMAGTGVFNVNPLVYKTSADGDVTAAHTPDMFDHSLTDWSHIEADLVNGWTYTKGNTKPANLSEFIQKIRDCAEVKYVFDADRFAQYDNLKGYKVDATGTQLWYAADPKATITATTTDTETAYLNDHISAKDYTDAGIIDYLAQADTKDAKGAVTMSLAATINNHLYSTAGTNENKKNLPWDYSEVLNANTINGISQAKEGKAGDAAYAVIRLHEEDNYNGTFAAKAQIGQKVPVNLEVTYNKYNKVAVQKFEVFFIEPLSIDGGLGDNFKDAVINGSFLEVGKNFTFTDWNKYTVAATPVAKPASEKQQYAHQLYDYYCVKNVKFDVAKATTCLSKSGDTWIATEGVTDGPLPAGAMLKMMDWSADPKFTDKTKAVEVTANPTHLAYFNEAGTPVDFQYHLYVNASVDYKWGTMSKKGLPILVVPAEGTPTNADHK